MLEIFSQKLKDYGKLSEKDQKQLNQAHRQILKEKVLPAYQKLIECLERCAEPERTLEAWPIFPVEKNTTNISCKAK